MPTPILSRRLLNLVSEWCAGNETLRTIAELFDDADIRADLESTPEVSGERRTLVHQYYNSLDLSDPVDVRKLLRVIESILLHISARIGTAPPWGARESNTAYANLKSKFIRYLKADGFSYEGTHIVAKARMTSSVYSRTIERLDAPGLRKQVERLHRAVDEDPELAIGTAKEIVESVCKTILTDAGVEIDPNWEFPRLVARTRDELQLLPRQVPASARAHDAIRQVLGSLGALVEGMARLRNEYGTGHGHDPKQSRLLPRHARLAAGAAELLATFFFDTHAERTKVRP